MSPFAFEEPGSAADSPRLQLQDHPVKFTAPGTEQPLAVGLTASRNSREKFSWSTGQDLFAGARLLPRNVDQPAAAAPWIGAEFPVNRLEDRDRVAFRQFDLDREGRTWR